LPTSSPIHTFTCSGVANLRDPAAANGMWAQVDSDVTDKAPQVSLFTSNRLDFVSTRVGNYQFSPAVTGNFLIDQAWVK